MTSKITKAIASRIPIDLYDQVKKEADELEMNMNDYFLKILKARHERPGKTEKPQKTERPKPEIEAAEEKQPVKIKLPRKKKTEVLGATQEIIFPD